MIKKKENCEYCGEKMESKNAKRRFCSDKCRVYSSRVSKIADEVVKEMHKILQNQEKKEKVANSPSKPKERLKSPKIDKDKSKPNEGSLAWFLKNS